MLEIDLKFVKHYKKNDFGVATFEYQFTEKVIRVFLNGSYKKTIYYRELKDCKISNFDDIVVYVLPLSNKHKKIAIILDKKQDRPLISFLSNMLF